MDIGDQKRVIIVEKERLDATPVPAEAPANPERARHRPAVDHPSRPRER